MVIRIYADRLFATQCQCLADDGLAVCVPPRARQSRALPRDVRVLDVQSSALGSEFSAVRGRSSDGWNVSALSSRAGSRGDLLQAVGFRSRELLRAVALHAGRRQVPYFCGVGVGPVPAQRGGTCLQQAPVD